MNALLLLSVILLQWRQVFLKDTVVLAGDSTTLNNCFGSSVNWRHYGSKYPYLDVFQSNEITKEGKDLGYRIEEKENHHEKNLFIQNVTTDLAGKYECIDLHTDEKNSTELIVIDNLPECRVNMDEFIGPNDCDLPVDEIQLSCSVGFRNKSPELEWRRYGETIKVLDTNCATEGSLTKCSTTVRADVALNGSKFVCQTTRRAAIEQYNCTSNVSVLYTFGGDESERTAVHRGERVDCVANSSQLCSYKWVWYEQIGNDLSRTIESSDHILIAKKTGLHRCEAQCFLRDKPCLVFPRFIVVIQSENSPEQSPLQQTQEQENQLWTPTLIVLLILGLLPYLVLLCYLFKQWRRKSSRGENPSTTSESEASVKFISNDGQKPQEEPTETNPSTEK